MRSFKWIRLLLILTFSLAIQSGFCQDKIAVERCHQFLKGAPINCMQADDVDMLWVGTNLGLYIFNYFEGVRTVMEKGAVHALTEDSQGYMWVALEGGKIMRVDEKFKIDIGDFTVVSMKARNNLLWVGTEENGVQVWDIGTSSQVAHYKETDSKLLSDRIYFVHRDYADRIWIGTKKGLNRIDGNKWTTLFEEVSVSAVAENDRELWFGGKAKMWNLPEGEKTPTSVKIGRYLIHGDLKDMSFDSNSRLYLVSEIFSRYDTKDESTFTYDKKFGFNERNLTCVGRDKDGDMWLGTGKNGLFRFKIFFEDPPKLPLTLSLEKKEGIKCPDDETGIIAAEVKGGVAPFTYEWNCNGCFGEQAQNLSSGEYSLTVTDAEGAEVVSKYQLEAKDGISFEVKWIKSISREGARDGEISVLAKSNAGRVNYEWSDQRRASTRRALRMGDYSLTVTDGSGCSLVKDFVIGPPSLIPELQPEAIEVGQVIVIKQLFFDADSLVFNQSSIPALKELGSFLAENPNISIEIRGHTNGLPNHEYCDWLSNGRASKVAGYFYGMGISTEQVTHKGYGKRLPLAKNDTKEGRAKNQRVEVKITAIAKKTNSTTSR